MASVTAVADRCVGVSSHAWLQLASDEARARDTEALRVVAGGARVGGGGAGGGLGGGGGRRLPRE